MIEDFNVVFSILLFLLFERDEELLLLLFTRRRRRRLLIILGGSENEDAAWDLFLRNFTRVGRKNSHLTTSIKYYSFLLFLVVVHCFVRLFHAFELKFRLSLQR